MFVRVRPSGFFCRQDASSYATVFGGFVFTLIIYY